MRCGEGKLDRGIGGRIPPIRSFSFAAVQVVIPKVGVVPF
jgi:hypothetical protein